MFEVYRFIVCIHITENRNASIMADLFLDELLISVFNQFLSLNTNFSNGKERLLIMQHLKPDFFPSQKSIIIIVQLLAKFITSLLPVLLNMSLHILAILLEELHHRY